MNYIDNIMTMLRTHTGHDFSSYKKSTLHRRIDLRMKTLQIGGLETYVRFLQENLQELDFLFTELLIGVTRFFREPAEWDLLKDIVIPELLSDRAANEPIRVWVSGCSTGEEAYSLAIVFQEVRDRLNLPDDSSLQIFATDLDMDAIAKAREGIFPAGIEEDVSRERLNRYFVKADCGYQVIKSVRDKVIFAQQNMIMDPPFTKIDLLTCRNLMIYLAPDMQKKLISLFHCSLNPGGFLFLGSAESIAGFTDLFEPLHRKSRLYRRLQPLFQVHPVDLPDSLTSSQSASNPLPATVQNLQSLSDKLILQYFAPATVLVNSRGDILYITGRTGKYLELAAGHVNWNIFAMARKGLNIQLGNAFHKVLRQKEAVTLKNTVVINEAGSLIVDITINPIKEPSVLSGLILIVFTDVVTAEVIEAADTTGIIPSGSLKETELERELMLARQMWQAAKTEMQISQEEFKSGYEELQATNEELQSINEELTTTKEETLLSNEELKLINVELQTRLEAMSLLINNTYHQMNSLMIPALFLDNTLCIMHFTTQMSVISRLIPSDMGRPVTDITSDLIYPEFAEDIREVLETLVSIEKTIQSSNGSRYQTRILPYRTLENKIDGVVITFLNISGFQTVQPEMEAAACKEPKCSQP